MRKTALVLSLLMLGTVSAKDLKVATVDLQKLFKEYPGTAAAEKKFKTMAMRKERDLRDSADELTDLKKELSKSGSVLSAKQKRQKEDELESKEKALEMQDAQIRNELATKNNEMTQSILDEIKGIVAKLAKDKGVDLVLDSEKTVYVNGGEDLTSEIMKSKEFKSSDSDSSDDSDSKKGKK